MGVVQNSLIPNLLSTPRIQPWRHIQTNDRLHFTSPHKLKQTSFNLIRNIYHPFYNYPKSDERHTCTNPVKQKGYSLAQEGRGFRFGTYFLPFRYSSYNLVAIWLTSSAKPGKRHLLYSDQRLSIGNILIDPPCLRQTRNIPITPQQTQPYPMMPRSAQAFPRFPLDPNLRRWTQRQSSTSYRPTCTTNFRKPQPKSS